MKYLSIVFHIHRTKQIKSSDRNELTENLLKFSGIMAPPAKKLKTEKVASASVAAETTKSTENTNFVELFKQERRDTAKSILDFKFAKSRARILNDQSEVKEKSNGIFYWMFRDQRVQDNWAFLFAQKLALKNELPLHVCYCLLPKFLDANTRHYKFLVKGLQEIEEECNALNISFHLFYGDGGTEVPKFVHKHSMGAVVIDFCPLRVPMEWVENLKKGLPDDIPLIQVDAHNIVPVWVTSDKQEYAARTIRNKIVSKLSDYLTEFPPLIKHPYKCELKGIEKPDWVNCWNHVKIPELDEITWATPGYKGGVKQLEIFCLKRLRNYATKRNDPTLSCLSDLSPWFHFGQIAPQRAILQVSKYKSYKDSVDAFREEAIVRRELSDNFCFFNKHYDSLKGCAAWAQQTLKDHRKDKRQWIYTVQELEQAKTHDDLWNSAQIQMNKEGKMHGFLRMYWAKKILEWSETPEAALAAAIYLNDYYSIDGRDPNGYVGMYCIQFESIRFTFLSI